MQMGCQNVTPAKAANVKKVKSIKILPESGKLSSELFRTGILVKKMDTETVPELLIIDGANIPANATSVMQKVYAKGGTVVVWGADPKKVNELNKILPSPVVITDRKATSLYSVLRTILLQGLPKPISISLNYIRQNLRQSD